ncbi:cysteine dioxygenase family protein [Dokdonella sp.]|uniref:cysteine dioxygenase n=1 Tax=Dokdonella sp. TaxID=2291710 RepID=UPI001B29A93A|nr:cysteine dioxygenase family protein [Dokdonella sp.]MBO9664659.1 cysteine dioxygenase family protein [Dokdonella sp.]
MPFHPFTPNRSWLDAVRGDLAGLGDVPTVTAIEALSTRLAARALQIDAPRASAPERDRYRRHLLDGGGAHSCLLIEWPAAHRTPIHDHAGLWGIELVLDGVLEVEEFALGGDLDQPTLTPTRTLMLGAGDAATFTGRRYAHRCRNLSVTRPALSLHVYGGALDRYRAFQADPRGGHRAHSQHARIDATLTL